jgi:hypothetical protein
MNRILLSCLLLLSVAFGAAPSHAAGMVVDASESIKAGIDAPARDLAGRKMEENYFDKQAQNALLLDEKNAISFERGPIQSYQSLTMDTSLDRALKLESKKTQKKNAALDRLTVRLGFQPAGTVLGSLH